MVYKPRGLTSRQVDNKIARLLGTRRVGHVGTLDPLAEGLLPVLFGRSTRLAPFVDSGIKGYRAEVTLGVTTDTDDAEGNVIEETPLYNVTPERVVDVLRGFLGEIEQVPPRFCAKKVDGVPLYKRSRRGEDIPLQPKRVVVHSIENIEVDLPKVRFDIVCSTGTYLRALARDIGHRLGCGGHLSALTRTQVGPHRVEDAVPLEEILEAIRAGEPEKFLLDDAALLPHLPRIEVNEADAWRIAHGQIISVIPRWIKPGNLFAFAERSGRLIAIAERVPGGYRYKRVLV